MRKYPKGLYYDETKRRWRARVAVDGVIVSNSYHADMKEAEKAYKDNLALFTANKICNPISAPDMLQILRHGHG